MDNSSTDWNYWDTLLGMGISTKAVGAVVLAPVVMIALAGCMQQPIRQSEPLPSETSASPAVMTEEEAVNAAQQAYTEYLAMSDLIAQEGGVGTERLENFVTEAQYQNEVQGLSNYSKSNLFLAGFSLFDSVRVANPDPNNFSIYLCIDNSNARIISSDNTDVTPINRVDRWPLLVSFTFLPEVTLISGSETWTGSNFC